MDDDRLPVTFSIPAAGLHYFGLSRNGSYQAAKRGDLIVVSVGPKLKRVPRKAQDRKLEEDAARAEEDAARAREAHAGKGDSK